MKLKIYQILFLFGLFPIPFQLVAQSTFKGTVVDAADNQKLALASVVLLNAQDSVLIAHARADENGKFSIVKPEAGSFLLLITYPKYGEYNRVVLPSDPSDLGTIGLSSVAHILEEVLVTGKIPIVMKGDTTEYDASSFVVEKNAKVEDLLKVLPGITVDEKGNITAQGKTVEKVLVDGEEFFGNDPTLVTRNIRSDMVDKVQVFEKKSEAAERTGVDDGIRQQTINVTLKEDAKHGWFGKADVGGGAGDELGHYLGRLAFNKFKGSQKISAFAVGSNTGEISLGWQDSERFNFSDSQSGFTEDGAMYFMSGGMDAFSYWDGKGHPRAFNSGVSFMDAWQQNKYKLNMNYKYGRIWNDVEENNLSQNNLPNGQINSNTTSDRSTDANRHKVNATYDWRMDSLTTLSLNFSVGRDQSESNLATRAETRDGLNALLNDNQRLQLSDAEKSDYSVRAYLTRKFAKPGRSLSLNVVANGNTNDETSFLKSTTNLYRGGALDSTQLIDQMKDIQRTTDVINTSITYTEPITSKFNIGFGYDLTNSNSSSINDSYNKDNNGQYSIKDNAFSNDFDFERSQHQANVTLRYKAEKWEVNFINRVRHDEFFQRNNYLDREIKRDFQTYVPNIRYTYNISRSKNVSLNASRSYQLPSLTQINPLRENTDPLNIVVGNEALTPAHTNRLGASYSSYDMLQGFYTYFSADVSQSHNSIQSNVTIDPLSGIRTSTYVNLEDEVSTNYNFMGMTSFDLTKNKVLKSDLTVDLSVSDYYNYVNGALNENNRFSTSLNFAISKNTTKNVDFYVGLRPGWQNLSNSLQPEFNSEGFTFNSNTGFQWFLPNKFSLVSEFNYMYEAPTKAFNERFERLDVNPGLVKKFLEDESLILTLTVNDLLNQNKGFRRFQSGNTFQQNSYNTIGRYFMLTVTWDVARMGAGVK